MKGRCKMDNKINKVDLVKAMAEETGMTQKDSKILLDAFLTSVSEALANGDNVKLANFGTFSVRDTAERKARNPRTREEIIVPAGKKPVFKFSKSVRDQVKG